MNHNLSRFISKFVSFDYNFKPVTEFDVRNITDFLVAQYHYRYGLFGCYNHLTNNIQFKYDEKTITVLTNDVYPQAYMGTLFNIAIIDTCTFEICDVIFINGHNVEDLHLIQRLQIAKEFLSRYTGKYKLSLRAYIQPSTLQKYGWKKQIWMRCSQKNNQTNYFIMRSHYIVAESTTSRDESSGVNKTIWALDKNKFLAYTTCPVGKRCRLQLSKSKWVIMSETKEPKSKSQDVQKYCKILGTFLQYQILFQKFYALNLDI